MNSAPHNEVTATFFFQPTWVSNRALNPLSWQSAKEWKKLQEALQKAEDAESSISTIRASVSAFNEMYDTPQCVREAKSRRPPESPSTWPGWYGVSDMISIALGAPEPQWRDGYWWSEREKCPLQWVNSPADVAKLRVPDWGSVDIISRMLKSREQWQWECSDEPLGHLADILDITVPGQGMVQAVCYPAFVDLGIYLMGMTHFLTILGGEPETADAFMDFCFKLSTSYVDFLLRQQPEHFSGLFGFGGDGTCMLSPGLYDRYGAAWDDRLFKYVCNRYVLPDDIPCNLHSCGPSSHLYERWGKHPCNRKIAMMQTRLMPGQVGKLRASLPAAELQLTLHPPHFDVISANSCELREVLWNSALDAGQYNIHFDIYAVVHRVEDIWKVEQNLQVCNDVILEIRKLMPINNK